MVAISPDALQQVSTFLMTPLSSYTTVTWGMLIALGVVVWFISEFVD